MDLPYFPFYVRDVLGDPKVALMTTEEFGVYVLLLCYAWQNTPPGCLPTDDLTLSRIARLNSDAWTACKATVMACFDSAYEGKLYSHSRLRIEHEKAVSYARMKSRAGKASAKARHTVRQTKDLEHNYARVPTERQQKGGCVDTCAVEVLEDIRVISFSKFLIPSLEELSSYCAERAALGHRPVDPQQWLDHYTSNGWMVGRTKMKDWKAAVRTWERSEFRPNGKPASGKSIRERIVENEKLNQGGAK